MRSQPRYQKGDKIGGRFQVYKTLMGGMGEVYLGIDLEEMVPYALKTFHQHHQSSALRKAFEQEVTTWVALEEHPNIVRCFHMQILDNQPFVVLEWIAGKEGKGADLRGWLQCGSLNLRLALDFTIDICRGLIHAQQKKPGIVHRDLKPENILVAQGQVAKITDFGLAQIIQTTNLQTVNEEKEMVGRQDLLAGGGIVGTPAYMSPEQWQGEALDARTDIYAIGCILFEMLTGHRPFQSMTANGLRYQHLEGDIPKLSKDQTVSNALNTLLVRCLAKRREERFVTVDTLLQDLMLIYQQKFTEPKTIPVRNEFMAVDYNNRGLTYRSLRRYEEALTDLHQAIKLNPNYALAYNNRGNVYADLKRYQEALSDFNRAIELDPTLALVYCNRGVVYRYLHQYDEALLNFNRAIELDSSDVTAYSNRGLTYKELQRYEEALADHNQAIHLAPTLAQTYLDRGITYDSMQQYGQSLIDFDQAIKLDPNYFTAYYNRGLTYDKLQRYQEALDDLSQAIRLDPINVQAYMDRGIIYHTLSRYEMAITDFSQIIQLDLTNANAYYNRGLMYDELQQYEKALIDYSRVIELDPGFAKAHFNIGVILVNHSNLYDALFHFDQAARLGNRLGAQYAAQVRQDLRMIL